MLREVDPEYHQVDQLLLFMFKFIMCSPFACSVVILRRFSITAARLYSQDNLPNFRFVHFFIRINFLSEVSVSSSLSLYLEENVNLITDTFG